jgi:hypothetical protein
MHVAGLGKPQREGAGAGEQVGHALGFFQMPGHQVAHHLFGRLACLHEAARRRVDDHPAELELRRLLLDQDLAVEGQPRDARFRPHRLDDPQPVRLGKLERRVCCEVKPGRGVEHREAERLLADRHRRGQSSQRRQCLVDPLRGNHAGLDVNDVMALRPVEAEERALVGAPRGKHHPPPRVWFTGHQRRNLGRNVAAFQRRHHQPALPVL